MIIFNKSKFNIFFDTKLYISIKNKFIILCTVQFSYKNKSTDLYLPAYNVGSCPSVTSVPSFAFSELSSRKSERQRCLDVGLVFW